MHSRYGCHLQRSAPALRLISIGGVALRESLSRPVEAHLFRAAPGPDRARELIKRIGWLRADRCLAPFKCFVGRPGSARPSRPAADHRNVMTLTTAAAD